MKLAAVTAYLGAVPVDIYTVHKGHNKMKNMTQFNPSRGRSV